MKRSLIALAIGGAFALGAQADSSESFTIRTDIPVVCQATNNSVANPEIVELSNRETNLGSFTYTCNSSRGFVRTISSANNGVLQGRLGDIPYALGSRGGSGLNFDPIQLTSPKVTTLAGSEAFIAGQTGSIIFRPLADGGTSFAGEYADNVTITVVAN